MKLLPSAPLNVAVTRLRSAPHSQRLKVALTSAASLIVLSVVIVAGLVVFGTASMPPAIISTTLGVEAYKGGLPGIERYRARDGAQLSFRYYPAASSRVIFLIHGAAGSSSDMHSMARALQESGATVYVPDLRGHGDNYPRGDVRYVGQLDDDLADFLHLVKLSHRGAKFTLLGFSSGGGFGLRIAASTLGPCFDEYVLLSPFLGHDSPTNRERRVSQSGNDQVDELRGPKVSTARIVGLTILDYMGVHRFDYLPVIGFAVTSNNSKSTSTYSWRMQENFQPHHDFNKDIRSVSKPMTVLVGAADERFLPEAVRAVFNGERDDIHVLVLPGLNHQDMATNIKAFQAVVRVINNDGDQALP